MMKKLLSLVLLAVPVLALPAVATAQTPAPADNHDLGFKDTPILPGLPWHVHDPDRPHPPVVTPATTPGGPPSDAIVLFDGKDLSQWTTMPAPSPMRAIPDRRSGRSAAAMWRSSRIPATLPPKRSSATSSCMSNGRRRNPPVSTSQGRGNSGVLLMGRYEVQVLDPWNNPTYADGQASAIYGQWPPLANPGRKPGDWNVYDIFFDAPRLDGDRF